MKKVISINDLSGIGRCSLTVSLPILSALKLQCCPLPTAILSSQTGYDEYTFLDFTDHMKDYTKVWSNLNLDFDCICSGFLGSKNQVDIVKSFMNDNIDSFIVVDPVMGDDGSLYPIFDNEMCLKIKELVKLSNLTTPNFTEACLLTNRDYYKECLSTDNLISIAKEISSLGPSNVVITGIIKEDKIYNFGYDRNNDEHFLIGIDYNKCSYSGTGDIFTSIVCGLLVKGYHLKDAVNKATNFISESVNYTSQFKTDRNDGVMFEYFLGNLTNL